MKFEKEKEDSIVKDYLDGLNTVEIAKKWNTYNTSIRYVKVLKSEVIKKYVLLIQTLLKIMMSTQNIS